MRRYAQNKGLVSVIIAAVFFMFLVSCHGSRVKNAPVTTERPSDNKEMFSGPSDTPAVNHPIKEIKGSRPDLTRASSSNSTKVIRPTGSRIPSGAGRPKGSTKPVVKP